MIQVEVDRVCYDVEAVLVKFRQFSNAKGNNGLIRGESTQTNPSRDTHIPQPNNNMNEPIEKFVGMKRRKYRMHLNSKLNHR